MRQLTKTTKKQLLLTSLLLLLSIITACASVPQETVAPINTPESTIPTVTPTPMLPEASTPPLAADALFIFEVYPFAAGLAPVNASDKPNIEVVKTGFINASGEWVIAPQFDLAGSFSEELARIKVDGKWGYIDTEGQIVIEPQFDRARDFSEGLAAVKVGDRWGYINPAGQFIIEPHFDDANSFSEGRAGVEIDGKQGYINSSGQMVIEPQFSRAVTFSEGLALIEIDEKYGYIDAAGQTVIESQFDLANSFKEGLAAVEVKDKWGYIDPTGQIVIDPQFDATGGFSEGRASIVVKHQWGYIDSTGVVVIPLQFDSGLDFSEGLAAVKVGDKWGYIDPAGNMVINPFFDLAHQFSEGLTWLGNGEKLEREWAVIDLAGQPVWKTSGMPDNLLVMATISEPASAVEEKAILQTYETYQAALLTANGESAAKLVDTHTIQWYATILDYALTLPRSDLDRLELTQKMAVLQVRLEIPKTTLEVMTGKDLFVYAVEKGWIGENIVERTKLGPIRANKDQAWASLKQIPNIPAFYFVKDKGQWKLALGKMMALVDETLEQLMDQSGLTEDEFITKLLQTTADIQVDPIIFDGPLE